MLKDSEDLAILNKNEVLGGLPSEWPVSLLPEIQQAVRASPCKVVVLDDDPTGTQTVHGIPVLTEWSVESLRGELANDGPAFYLLTNSRSVGLAEAQALNREIGRNLVAAAQQTGRDFAVVSRSDSTLRGHFPGEVDALVEAIEETFDAWLIIPFFLEGGRYTINDIHYVAEGESFVPAAQTPFARDAAFGYRASNLRAWVEEKTGGQISAERVQSITIEDIRDGGPEEVAQKLLGLTKGSVCVVNAASYRDLEVFVRGLLLAEAQGKSYLYRTAASFVQVRAGLAPRPLLTAKELAVGTGGGLVVVGSYVPKSTTQLHELLAQADIVGLEVDVSVLLKDAQWSAEIERITKEANQALERNKDVVIYTSRQLITAQDAESSLSIGQRVSAGLVAIVRGISVKPRYLLAKGGITSSDVATKGLGVKQALVLGQILPGIPVWQLGAESRHPGLPYIVFPGNVGGADALVEIVHKLRNGD
ncbi:MAG: four-carbon acid sugar kinase family protein [Ardenticatenaceae bacterium]